MAATLSSEIICIAWSIAYVLHVWGFHEASLEVCHVSSCVKYIEQLLKGNNEESRGTQYTVISLSNKV
ncbi:MAG: hypothetical protein DRJ40_02530 [Thermoprotei archaeon]|nr:MAG: hypothetical protein DRJ40_02530 [Thermoprotei archaeon]